MSSDQLEDLLLAYALGAAEDTDRQLVEERVAWDPAARARLAELEDTVRLAAHELGPPDHVWDRLAGAVFPGEPRVPHPRRLVNRATQRARRARRVLPALGAAACLAVLVTGIVLASGGSSPAPNLSVAARAA
jgi:anti-sigma factor RsiW